MFCFTLQNELIAEHLVRRVSVMSGSVKQAEEVGAGDDTSFFFFLFFFIFLLYVMLFILFVLIFTKIISLLFYLFIFFMKITFIFSCSGMFRNVPECSVFLVLSTPIQNTKIDFIVSDHLRFYGCMKFSVLRIFRPFFYTDFHYSFKPAP